MNDCGDCLDLVDASSDVPEHKLSYGDWLRTHVNAQQSKVVQGSLHRNYSRPSSSDQGSWRTGTTQVKEVNANNFTSRDCSVKSGDVKESVRIICLDFNQ